MTDRLLDLLAVVLSVILIVIAGGLVVFAVWVVTP